MEFWGVEVPIGKSLACNPGQRTYIHISQAALGETKNGKQNERVALKVKVGHLELVVGTLSQGRCDQTALDLIFEKEFVLAHNSTTSSVYFSGYKTDNMTLDELPYDDVISGEPKAQNDKTLAPPIKSVPKTPLEMQNLAKPQAIKVKSDIKEEKEDASEEDASADGDDDDHDDVPYSVKMHALENGEPETQNDKTLAPPIKSVAKTPSEMQNLAKPQAVKFKSDIKEENDDASEEDASDGDDVPCSVKMHALEDGEPETQNDKTLALPIKSVAKTPSEMQAVKVKSDIKEENDDASEEDASEGDDDDDSDGDDDDDDDDYETLEDASDDDLGTKEGSDADKYESKEGQPKSGGKKSLLDGVKDVRPGKKQKVSIPMEPHKHGNETDAEYWRSLILASQAAKKKKADIRTPAPASKKQQQHEKKDVPSMKLSEKDKGFKSVIPSSGNKIGQSFCQSCNRNFQSKFALAQHNSAKHKC